ncbi:hypothetical protein HS041_22630 [Planomonospora sp. ID67723]|uniref:DUF7825 domain-containing protein n=1 Tax=Planomonospora sp. ID67723 TaxID=2738134 RepID=UPI0018C40397|nr:DUF6493 family protein [Planomonospora sp. ID67723]MBG0830562.1 hypothetical protein [Planomonospora sp. ID67723]
MNPWEEVLARIEAENDERLVEALNGLGDADRREVAARLPGHLVERSAGGFGDRLRVRELTSGYRLAGAACMAGAAQVAAWLNRRELRRTLDHERDAVTVMSVLRRRPEAWRRDLAVRLVKRLRPPAGPTWWRLQGLPGWDLAAALVIETGIEPPDSDPFTVGWVWRVASRQRKSRGRPVLAADPLLDHLVPRLFHAQGVAAALTASESRQPGRVPGLSVAGELAALAQAGRLSRQALVSGCASRFMAGGDAAEIGPFVTLWRLLEPTAADVPVLDFVRLLPSGSSPFVQLALDELRRAEAVGALDDELFAEAVGTLVFRPEKKHVAAAVKWLADTPASRGGGAAAALACVFDVDSPALRERAVRLAVKLAPHTDDAAREAIREAASRLPAELRDRVAAAFGAIAAAAEPEPPAVPVLVAPPPPALAPPIPSAADLAAELYAVGWPDDPGRYERVLAALVEMTHRDRDGVLAVLDPEWRSYWEQTNVHSHAYPSNDRDPRFLLQRCALALALPDVSRELTAALAERADPAHALGLLPQRLVQHRLREVVALFERGATIPVLLATPTAATGHLDAETLIDRMERLGGAEPLEADFQQALLRLPRHVDESLLVRAEKLPTQAGRRLAGWLRDGGLPDPVVHCEVRRASRTDRYRPSPYEVHARAVPPEGLPAWLHDLCAVRPASGYAVYPDDVVWWPTIMPSHREVVAAYMVQCLPWLADRIDSRVDAVAALARGDGPVGRATAITIAACLAHPRPARRAAAAEALTTLAVRGQLPAPDLGWAVAELVRAEQVTLRRITAALDDLIAAGAHAEIWQALAAAVPLLLPTGAGGRTRNGLGELLNVAARAAVLAGARGEIPGLAELAARKGSSLVLQEARRLHRAISP